MTVLLTRDDREYLCTRGEELQTDLGVVTVPLDIQPGDVIKTHLGHAFTVRRLRGPDLFHHFTRSGSPMLPRDIGLAIGHTGIESGDTVLDVGTGTGVLAAYVGRIGATVISYEKNEEFASIARDNMELAGVGNTVDIRTGDVLESIDELSGFDVMTLDFGEAPTLVQSAQDILVQGGMVAAYSPFIENTRAVVEAARTADLTGIETVETIQREMEFESRGSRPSTKGVGHTGYLMFARR